MKEWWVLANKVFSLRRPFTRKITSYRFRKSLASWFSLPHWILIPWLVSDGGGLLGSGGGGDGGVKNW